MFSLKSSARKLEPSNHSSSSTLRIISEDNSPRPSGWLPILLLILIALGSLYVGRKYYRSQKDLPPGLVVNPEGDMALSSKREAKLAKELEEIDNAVQYALVATKDGVYPCYACPSAQKVIFLYKGNVWKYGVTRKEESERYPNGNYGAENLLFLPLFWGTYGECLKQEKIMIYNYPFLPEAKERDIIILRPPGNKYDS
ncbi:MAG: hypothetical protein ACRBG0_26670 [Lewinella sp.]|uniref:hypothetical protein n=1 Tax=Lewinella sp. TaxID=2004506 RepID=UPI003D6ABEBC